MRHHLFADDMQGFRRGDPSDISVVVTGIEELRLRRQFMVCSEATAAKRH